MTNAVLILSGILILVVLFLLFRVQQLTSVISGDFRSKVQRGNKFNALMFLAFFVFGTIAMFYSANAYWDDMILPLASEHGSTTDTLFWVTMAIITFVFVLTNGLLFYFSYKYQYKETNKALFYPENHKLELIWTLIPAIVLAALIFGGWKSWSKITGPAPENSIAVEIMGKQFAWMVRYPGEDGLLGKTDYRNIDDVNEFGMDCADKNGYDDFIPREIHIPVGHPVLLKIRARDVLHSVFLPHFRVKMDAVPGMPTRFWFVPTKTTAEMRIESGNPNFNYELACTEVCGRGHFAMKKLLIVETMEEFEAWKKTQTPFFAANDSYACKKEFLKGVPSVGSPTETDSTSGSSDTATTQAVVDTLAK